MPAVVLLGDSLEADDRGGRRPRPVGEGDSSAIAGLWACTTSGRKARIAPSTRQAPSGTRQGLRSSSGSGNAPQAELVGDRPGAAATET